ncbi:hypothetical protein [Rhabdothermincola salaria]|uniref:hypothetical protein n=1 Tax=Rhabdothermincola salaria TaxID=2903142 RepID=UPI001E486C7A|nr:hypothetical protein [Rhabdothermincola salaria]MCD9623467.1 hypothetical protein [Rhabdothermincola salaria]
MQATSVRFAAAARVLGQVARRRGLDVPSFRSPPRLEGADRSLRRHRSGGATVSVRLRERPWSAVVADMIEGVVAANRLVGPDADRARTALWAAVEVEAQRTRDSVARSRRHAEEVAASDGREAPPRRFAARRPLPAPDQRRPGRPPLRVVPGRRVA